jgi:hypothetical protein
MVLFFKKQTDLLSTLEFSNILEMIHPYRLLIGFPVSVNYIVKALLNACISSSVETMFEDLLEGLAIFINQKVFSGWKSEIEGIDLEFDNENGRNIVSIKSGPNWGNSSQVDKMLTNFNTAKKTLRTSNSKLHIICVNGCCYGKDNNPDKGAYFKYCGQRFWEFIGGNENIYTDIIEPLGHKAKERNEYFDKEYSGMLNKFTKNFIESFCDDAGKIDWKKLVEYNSAKEAG